MTKKIVLLCILAIGSQYLIAQSMELAIEDENNLAVLLTLGVAICALILAVVNMFRISHNKKITEVILVNQIDDINTTMEAVKLGLSRDLRNLRKEIGKSQGGPKPNQGQPAQAKNTDENEDIEVKEPAEKKPFKKRSSNYRRRPPHKKAPETNSENEG